MRHTYLYIYTYQPPKFWDHWRSPGLRRVGDVRPSLRTVIDSEFIVITKTMCDLWCSVNSAFRKKEREGGRGREAERKGKNQSGLKSRAVRARAHMKSDALGCRKNSLEKKKKKLWASQPLCHSRADIQGQSEHWKL